MFDDSIAGAPDVQADFCEEQIFDDNCAVAAETSIINQFNPDLHLDQQTAAYISAQNGWYNPGAGTDPDAIGNMMDLFGIDNHANTHATVADLVGELEQGHGVIVGVNSSELWETGPLAELKHEICKACGLDNSEWMPADHAVVLTGIDWSDADHPMAILNDSGVPDGAAVHYPLDQFLDAFENSDCHYVATNDPLPSMQQAGDDHAHFWGAHHSDSIVSGVAGMTAYGLTDWITHDHGLATAIGKGAQSLVSNLFDDEDFARMI